MRKLFFVALALCLFVPLGVAQVNDVAPDFVKPLQTVGPMNNTSRGLGDLLWSLDVEGITGDIRLLGVERASTNYWATGAYDFTIAYLYEFTGAGVLLNTYTQPTGNWGYWGWRDLCWDGTWLHAGADSTFPNHIVEIDPANGQPTGVQYGPYPVNPCRALAYNPNDDTFWTASFSSSLYHCEKNGNSTSYPNPGYAMYGCAFDGSSTVPRLWWWSQDGVGCLASEFDLNTNTFTGVTFDGDSGIGGIAGGAGAYDTGNGWELVGMHQSSPDAMGVYELGGGIPDPLTISQDTVISDSGDTVSLFLNSPGNAGWDYIMVAGLTGATPGTTLPDGTNLPVHWDAFTTQWMSGTVFAIPGGFGQLDGNGIAQMDMIFRCDHGVDFTMTFAFTAKGKGMWFASNDVDLLVISPTPPPNYQYDDGSTENLLGWSSGGDMCWLHWFDAVGSDTITDIGTAWGSAMYPGYNPGNGTSAGIYVFEDPNDDGDPSDNVYITSDTVIVTNVDTDIVNIYPLTTPANVSGGFFVGADQIHPAGTFVAPMDTSTSPYNYEAWVTGAIDPAVWDPKNWDFSVTYEMSSIGLPAYFLLRAYH